MSDSKRGFREPVMSDPPEPPRPLRRVAVGCLAFLVLSMLAGAALYGAIIMVGRFGVPVVTSGGGGDDDVDDPDPIVDPVGTDPDPLGPSTTGGDPLESMRRRYVLGPHVRLEGMIPSDTAYARRGAVSPWVGARSSDSPWIVFGAEYQRTNAPPPSGSGPIVRLSASEEASRPVDVIPTVPAHTSVDARDGAGGTDVQQYVVSFDGYPGHFVLPVRVQTELGPVAAAGSTGATVRFGIGAALRPDGSSLAPGQSMTVNMRIAAIDGAGRISSPVQRLLNVVPLGQGDVEVAMQMNLATDLDLYVTDPSGSTVYYGNRTIASHGQLDLDANAGCGGNMGVQAEHVFWPRGQAPAGNYTVRVAHYRNCAGGRPIDYRVTVRACGETVVVSGHFVGNGNGQSCMGPASDPTWCQDVVTFQVPSCGATN